MWVWSLGWEDPLEKVMAIHSSIVAWRIPMDRGAWQTTVYGVAKSWTWLSDWAQYFLSPVLQDHFTVQEHILLHFPCSEKVFAVFPLAVETKSTFWSMAFKAFTLSFFTYPGYRPHRIFGSVFEAAIHFYTFIWRMKWQPTPVFLPGESCGQRSLVGCCP